MRNVLSSKASKARNALMRWQQSLASSFCCHGKSLVSWEWLRKLWDRRKCGFRCGLGCPEQCVLHPELFPFLLLSPVTLSCWRERAQLVDLMGKERFLSKYSMSSTSESLTPTIQPFLLFLSAIFSIPLVAGKLLKHFTDAQQQPEQSVCFRTSPITPCTIHLGSITLCL